MIRKLRNNLLLKNTAWLMLLQAVNIILPFVTVPYVTRVFGVESYGIFSLSLNWITYFQLVVEYGFNLSAARRVTLLQGNDHGIQRTISSVTAARLILLALCFAMAFCLGFAFDVSTKQFYCMLILFVMLLGIALQLNWLFQGLQDMKVITIATAISRGVSVLLIFCLIKSPDQLALYALLYSVTFLLSALITHYIAWKKYKYRFGRLSFARIMSEYRDGLAIFVSSAAGKAIGSVGVTVLGAVAAAPAIGSYTAILKIPQLVSMMFLPISQAIFPRANQEATVSSSAAFRFVARVGAPVVLGFGVLLVVVVFGRVQIVSFLFGVEYLECIDTMAPLAGWVLLGILNNFLGIQLCIPLGYQREYSIAMTVDVLFAVAANILLGTSHGAIGVALGAALGELLLMLMLVFILSRKAGGRFENSTDCIRDKTRSN